ATDPGPGAEGFAIALGAAGDQPQLVVGADPGQGVGPGASPVRGPPGEAGRAVAVCRALSWGRGAVGGSVGDRRGLQWGVLGPLVQVAGLYAEAGSRVRGDDQGLDHGACGRHALLWMFE